MGNVSTIGGIIPGLFKGALVGTDAYLAYQNSQGGVDGRMFKLISGDDQLSCDQNRVLTQQMVNEVQAFVGSFSVVDDLSCGGGVIAAHPQVPDVSESLEPSIIDLPNNFEAQPQTPGFQTGILAWFANHYPQAVTKVAEIFPAGGPTAQYHGELAAMAASGYKVIYTYDYGPNDTDFTQQILAMKSAGVQMLDLTWVDTQTGARILQQTLTQQFHPQVIWSGGGLYGAGVVKQAGGPAAIDGTYLALTTSLFLGEDATAVPADATFLAWVNHLYPGFQPDLYTLYGWASAQLYVTALEQAGPNPTQASLLAALDNIHDFDASGLLPPADPAGKKPPTCWLLARAENGHFVRYDSPPTGYRCDGGYFTYNGN